MNQSTDPMHIDRLVIWYENLSVDSLTQIADYYTKHVHFRDPFHEFRDRERLQRIYAQMFAVMEYPRFRIDHVIRENHDAAMYWRFLFRYRASDYAITGSSCIRFAADGRVESHLDYWDAASEVYEHIPLIGRLLRGLRRRIAQAGTNDETRRKPVTPS